MINNKDRDYVINSLTDIHCDFLIRRENNKILKEYKEQETLREKEFQEYMAEKERQYQRRRLRVQLLGILQQVALFTTAITVYFLIYLY
jgi:hypothetical protein